VSTERRGDTTEHLLRDLAPQVLGAVARRYGDFAAAEDAVQEALIAAASQWPMRGLPDNPQGWLYQVAMRRLTDIARNEQSRRKREDVAAVERATETAQQHAEEEDDSLVLLFMCCHPTLTPSSAIALTLRAVGGLSTADIAAAFLVPEATMAQRISRAKQSIRTSNIPFRMPTDAERVERLTSVLHVLYLIFNEGYTSSSGPDLRRTDLSSEAIRLTRAAHALLPADSEVAGLLALMLLTDARRFARSGPDGELIPLDEQDRTLWDRAQIGEGTTLVSRAMSEGMIGAYQIQAAIAALHDEAPSTEATDWRPIHLLYGLLERISDNPMVSLNRAIAASMVDGPAAGLALLDVVADDPRLKGHYRLDAVRAHLHEQLGNNGEALAHYRTAAERTMSIPERNYLATKAARLAQTDS
jgi:RNA polymerase sigma factor (sigma-70 family)